MLCRNSLIYGHLLEWHLQINFVADFKKNERLLKVNRQRRDIECNGPLPLHRNLSMKELETGLHKKK